eukprot:206067_1
MSYLLRLPPLQSTPLFMVQREESITVFAPNYARIIPTNQTIVPSIVFMITSMAPVVTTKKAEAARKTFNASHIALLCPNFFTKHKPTFSASTFPSTIHGAVLERMKNKAYITWCLLTIFVNYSFVYHWVWRPDGWLAKLGFVDGAGSIIHCGSFHRRHVFPHCDLEIRTEKKFISHRTWCTAYYQCYWCIFPVVQYGWLAFNVSSQSYPLSLRLVLHSYGCTSDSYGCTLSGLDFPLWFILGVLMSCHGNQNVCAPSCSYRLCPCTIIVEGIVANVVYDTPGIIHSESFEHFSVPISAIACCDRDCDNNWIFIWKGMKMWKKQINMRRKTAPNVSMYPNVET